MRAIPSSFTINTGEQVSLDDFFVETKDFLEECYGLEEREFSIRSGEVAYDGRQITDDRVTYLLYWEQVVAAVFETRTEMNYVRYTFFRKIGSPTKI